MLIFLSYISYFSWYTFDLKTVTKCTENKAAVVPMLGPFAKLTPKQVFLFVLSVTA